ncbi:DUF4815 domain-containing protein [Thauera butanivorans]|uniref:DUF4815 domain-containing protein n=1 Tax=Thauera butanivorans TaxID=86174 RepID=UPI00083852D9|nr:DUF4815 domain-containing protein [Thauera butanivorans]
MLYNRFDPADNYDAIEFRPDRVLQSAELNELQSMAAQRLREISDVLFSDGDVIRDARIIVSAETGDTQCEAGAVYLDGAVRGVPPAHLVIPITGIVTVGIYLQEVQVDESRDPGLLNPAVGTRGYNEPGATRRQINPVWGLPEDGTDGRFFPVWVVESGVVRPKEAPPNLDVMSQAIARYDRDSAGGSYIVTGLELAMSDDQPGGQVYTLSEGRARVGGVAVERTASHRITYPAQPDLRFIDSEPHPSTTTDPQRITLMRPPAQSISSVRITAQRTVAMTHGGHVGASDPLPEAAVLTVVNVGQGATTYTAGTDYVLTAGQIDWSPAGAEPAPGSTYEVTFTYIAAFEPTDADSTGFTVHGALPGTLVLVSYQQMLPRIDRVCLDRDGVPRWIRGIAASWSPKPPPVPDSMLLLASVLQTWTSGRRVVSDGTRMVPMFELAGYRLRQQDLAEAMAELRLAVDIQGRFSGIRRGQFADPMISDEMRDAGVPQTAAIVNGVLTLAMDVEVHLLGEAVQGKMAPAHDHDVVLSQALSTGVMLVNPYMSFAAPSAAMRLVPAVDRWTETNTTWLNHATKYLYVGVGNQDSLVSRQTSVIEVSRNTAAIEYLRPISVRFEITGWGPGEPLAALTFDGITLDTEPASITADAVGALSGAFIIPAGVPAGTKLVQATGAWGNFSSQMFAGQGTRATVVQQNVTTETWQRWSAAPGATYTQFGPRIADPLAQTFALDAARQISGVDLVFTAKESEVIIQIREFNNGTPANTALIEARVPPEAISITEATRITWPPVLLQAGREYVLVIMCNDATTAVAVAELGKYDRDNGRWVTSQPYNVGVLLSSSNATVWTTHQDRDLMFQLLAASYFELERRVPLGAIELNEATDIMVTGYADRPSVDAGLVFEVAMPDGSTLMLGDGQVARLAAPVSGDTTVVAVLSGSHTSAAVLEPGVQLISGHLHETDNYVTPAINAGAGGTLRVVFEALIPGGASIAVRMQADDDGAPLINVPYLSAAAQAAGFLEISHELPGITADRLRVHLLLQGGASARPQLRNLRVVVLED